ncbi:hypothetical protein [Paracidobacterium acidisoli]|uniref:Uncharacterized protein n=1 Tax=Paracidobacterium acidisoli TaxID=2303751 RepID=A0A372ITB0_9BACT|nr:hypothetical protein [Paracidobacterium acidisoli]MBT9329599.1 hypothetical protein [Paracidobacterium acidisoli]
MKCWRYLRTCCIVLVGCLWITAASWSEHVAAQYPLCQPSHLPCCPQPVSNTSESCPACHLSITSAAKEVLEQERQQERQKALSQNLSTPGPVTGVAVSTMEAHRELTAGLYYPLEVFALKEDLRV